MVEQEDRPKCGLSLRLCERAEARNDSIDNIICVEVRSVNEHRQG